MPVYAASTSQDGLEVTLTTDKETYDKGEQIEATLTVTNTNDFAINNVSLENMIPEGYKLSKGSTATKQVESLDAGETVSLTVTYVSEDSNNNGDKPGSGDNTSDTHNPGLGNENNSGNNVSSGNDSNDNVDAPNTGDDSSITLWVALMVVSAISMGISVIILLRGKQGKRFFSLFLCLTMLGTIFSSGVLPVKAAEVTEKKRFEIVENIEIDSSEIRISAVVKYTLNSSKPENSYTVTFDSNGGSKIEPQIVDVGMTATEPETPVLAGYTFIGWYEEKNPENLENAFDFDFTSIEKDLILYAVWMKTVDTDGDQLIDGIEEIYGLDSTNVDTDGDGVSDYLELIVLDLNPLSVDTDANGISDGNEDPDKDGLVNSEENHYNTDPLAEDTDEDQLSDFEEITIYNTNPLKKDTDGDEVSDAKEIELHTDPLVAQTSFVVDTAAEGDNGITASVEVELSGEQVDTLHIECRKDHLLFPEDIPGYLSNAYNFTVDGSFTDAVISFSYDSSLLNDDSKPTIYYFNEDDQELEALETTISGNTASATVTHFSTYILIDRNIYEKSFVWQDVWDSDSSYSSVEIVLVIDDSGSMDSNDRQNKRLEVAKNLVDKLPSGSKIGIVNFTNQTKILTTELTEDRVLAKSLLTTEYFHSSGGTNMYNAINNTFPLYKSVQEDVLKVMVVLSDGISSDTSRHSSTISAAQQEGVRIYTVGLGNSSSYFTKYLQPLANSTNANFYLADNASDLVEIYDDINNKIDIETDSDNDKLPDYYEDNMILFNGRKLVLDKNNPDTDGDGKLDGEEIVLKHKYNEDKTQVIVTGKILSDPTENPNYVTVAYDIPKETIADEKNLSMTEWHPLQGLTETMLQMDDSLEAIVDGVPVTLDAINFGLSWLNNSQKVTRLYVVTGKDKTMTLKYGTSIELNLSGKKTSLSSLLVNRLYNISPSIVFTANKKADECIRNWFGLSGDGKFSMELDFGKAYIGDYGYYLLIENGDVFQVPIIHPDTTFKVYYTKDKHTEYIFDAADILRTTKIKLADSEKEKVLKQLRDNGFYF